MRFRWGCLYTFFNIYIIILTLKSLLRLGHLDIVYRVRLQWRLLRGYKSSGLWHMLQYTAWVVCHGKGYNYGKSPGGWPEQWQQAHRLQQNKSLWFVGPSTQQVYNPSAKVMEGWIHTEQKIKTTVGVEQSQGQGFKLARLRVGSNGARAGKMSNGGRSTDWVNRKVQRRF